MTRKKKDTGIMAREKKDTGIPEGFEELSSQLEGFFVIEEGNQIQGILEGHFVNRSSKFGPKKVYKIQVTVNDPPTRVVTKNDGEKDAVEGGIVGLDEKGFLKKLAEVPKGTEIFVRCNGKEGTARVKGQQPAWTFTVAAVPFKKGGRKAKSHDEGDDDIPF